VRFFVRRFTDATEMLDEITFNDKEIPTKPLKSSLRGQQVAFRKESLSRCGPPWPRSRKDEQNHQT
jgi:hypothetical protein